MSNLTAIVKKGTTAPTKNAGLLSKIGTVLKNNKGKAALLGLGIVGIGLLLAGKKDDNKDVKDMPNVQEYSYTTGLKPALAYEC